MAKKQTHLAYVLDESGSMHSVRSETISLFNDTVGGTRTKHPKSRMTLVTFNENVRFVYRDTPVAKIPGLSTENYAPGGFTALFDAIGQTILAVEKNMAEGDSALIIVQTDGWENSSREFNDLKIKEMIQKREKAGNWTFVYVAATADAFLTGAAYGFSDKNVMKYTSSRAGTQSLGSVMAASVVAYAGNSARGVGMTNTFFEDAGFDNTKKPEEQVEEEKE